MIYEPEVTTLKEIVIANKRIQSTLGRIESAITEDNRSSEHVSIARFNVISKDLSRIIVWIKYGYTGLIALIVTQAIVMLVR